VTKFSTKQILEGIVSNDTRVLDYIYSSFFPVALKFVKSRGGGKEDAFDIFQEAVVVILQRVRKSPLELDCLFGTYLQSVIKVLWVHQRLADKRRNAIIGSEIHEYEDIADLDSGFLDSYHENEKSNFIQRHFIHLSEGCQTLLRLYIEDVSVREIAEIMGVTESFVKKKKYECKQKLIKRVIADAGYKDLFL